jgi:hypothetical protein
MHQVKEDDVELRQKTERNKKIASNLASSNGQFIETDENDLKTSFESANVRLNFIYCIINSSLTQSNNFIYLSNLFIFENHQHMQRVFNHLDSKSSQIEDLNEAGITLIKLLRVNSLFFSSFQ